MPTTLKMFLFATLIMLPSLSSAAEPANTVLADPKPLASAPPAVTAPLAATTTPPMVASTRIGYVDLARIGSESDNGKTLKTLLTTKKEQLQKKVDAKKKQFEKLQKSIESQLHSLTPAQRETKAKEYQKKLEELQKFAQKSEEEFNSLQEKETGMLYEAIEKAAVTYGTTNGFALIVIKKELLYIGKGVDAVDVTDALIKALNTAELKK